METQGQVGLQYSADGASINYRQGKTGETIVSDGFPRYYEPTSRGGLFGAANQTGVTTQAGLSATTPALTLFNPKGSGVNCILVSASCVNTVAFAAAAVIWVGVNTNIAANDVTGTNATIRNMYLGNGKQPQCNCFTAATLPAAPVAIATLGVGLTGAITTTPAYATLTKEFAGSIVLSPGSAISLQTSTASGASGFFGEFVWMEVPI